MRIFLFKTLIFLLMGTGLFIFWGNYWAMWGKIDKKAFHRILVSMPPWQKKELAEALNYYYRTSLVDRYTKGLVLCCSPEPESIKKQFNWYYRNTVDNAFNEMPHYHEIVRDALAHQQTDDMLPADASTFELELILEKALGGEYSSMTRKDGVGLGISAISMGLRIFAASINPFVGVGVTAVSVAQMSMSDMTKLLPAIICFMNIRNRNFSYTFLLSWGLCVFLFYRPRAKKDDSKKGPAKPAKKKREKAPAKKKGKVSKKKK